MIKIIILNMIIGGFNGGIVNNASFNILGFYFK